MYFSEEDNKIIESLKYDKKMKPSFNLISSSLMWFDEFVGLSDEGMTKLSHLFVARCYIFHLTLSQKKLWRIDKDFYEKQWKLAIESNLKWPGFEKKRLYLSRADKKYLDKELEYASSNPDDY